MGDRILLRVLIRSSLLAVLVIGLLAGAVTAQKRGGKVRKAVPPAPVPDMRRQADEVAEQIRLLSRFILVFGKVVNGLEVARDQAERNLTSPAIEASNRQTREGLVASIDRLAAGIGELTESFKSDPGLQIQYLRIAAARDAVTEAAGLAARQRFDEAGSSLVTAVGHLTDTILSMKLN